MFSSHFAVSFAQFIEAKCEVENEDVVGAAPRGDAPTTSEWSINVLPTELRPILEIWRYVSFIEHQNRMVHVLIRYSINFNNKVFLTHCYLGDLIEI